ncbi:MAG: hypothetical protein Fur003_1130 [Candidatus Dojkabacteria bacterium]
MQPNNTQTPSGPMDFSYPAANASTAPTSAGAVPSTNPTTDLVNSGLSNATTPLPPLVQPALNSAVATMAAPAPTQTSMPAQETEIAPPDTMPAQVMPAAASQSSSTSSPAPTDKKSESKKEDKNPLELLANKLNSFKESLIETDEEKAEKAQKVKDEKSSSDLEKLKQAETKRSATVTSSDVNVPINQNLPADTAVVENPAVTVNAPTPSPDTTVTEPVQESMADSSIDASPMTDHEVGSAQPDTTLSIDTPVTPNVGASTDTMPDFSTPTSTVAAEPTSTPDSTMASMAMPTPEPVITDVSQAVITPEMPTETVSTSASNTPSSPMVEIDPAAPALSSEKTTTTGTYPFTIQQLLDLVVSKDASDLHITAGYPAIIRVDGDLKPVSDVIVTEKQAEELIYPVLPEQKKELLEVNREVDLAYAHKKEARFRINAYYQKQSLAAAFRLIPNRIRNIDELKLPQIYHQLTRLQQGLVLVTGPTGSGKSTTLAAIIQEINQTRPVHIITIEDPIEYVLPPAKALIDQRELHDDTHSWEIAMKSALRQDPDVVLVGEMRDYETIAAAITLAETGHLVFATLHTNSASQTIDRIIDVFPEHQQAQVRSQLSNVIEAVIAQRLIPLDKGGRQAVSEIMIATPAIRNLVREAKTHQIDNVIMTSADIGMISIEHSLVKMVREGLITMQKAQEYAVHPEEVTRLLKG